MSSTWLRKRRVGLDVHLPGPAEPVEVVDVERAEVDLQRVEQVGERHALAPEPRPGRCRRRAAARSSRKLVNTPASCGCWLAWRDQRLARPEQLDARPAPPRSSQLHLEAAGGPQPVDRRRREHGDERLLDRREACVQAPEPRRDPESSGRSALVERLEHDEHDRRVGRVDEPVRPRGRRTATVCATPGCLPGDARPSSGCTASVRSSDAASGSWTIDDQVPLVLRRDEPVRHGPEAPVP